MNKPHPPVKPHITYNVALTADGAEPPPEVRLRRALKCLRRHFGLRCVSVVEARPDAAPRRRPAGRASR
jgi:hypothetical protein